MRSLIRNILLKSGLLYRIQYSQLYRKYKIPGYKKEIDELFKFYNELFKGNTPSLIFDIGANAGNHTYIFSKICRKVVCVEPDEMNNKILHSRFGKNKNIIIEKKAVTEKEGVATFYMEAEGSVFNTLSNKWVALLKNEGQSRFDELHVFKETKEVQTISLDKLIQQYGIPDYIKIDVEGFEKEVISGLHKKISIIGFECNLPEFTGETVWIIDHLSKINNDATFNFMQDKGFELENNIAQKEMSDLVNSGKFRFMDIYCFNERTNK